MPFATSRACKRQGLTPAVWKVGKRERQRFLPLLAEAVKDPDEIWVAAEYHHASQRPVLRRRYLAEFTTGDGETVGTAVFEWGRDGWTGVTTFQSDTDEAAEELREFRRGVRLYRRGEE